MVNLSQKEATMIKRLQFYTDNGVDPHENLAKESYLLEQVREDTCLLYLWQNRSTVVIGRNQNALAECRVELLTAEGGTLARRLSGGGAVFHDLGNLNFTFLCTDDNFDLPRQMRVIREACRLAGIETELSGRNDLLADGRKFSGNAFYHAKGRSYHHGTLLISSDLERLGRYLTPPRAKLSAKGIPSVKARVLNLSSLSPGLTPEAMKAHLLAAFGTVYGLSPEAYGEIPAAAIAETAKRYASTEYLYDSPIPYDVRLLGLTSLGSLDWQLAIKDGRIRDMSLYTDSLDTELPSLVKAALLGRHLDLPTVREALRSRLPREVADELSSLLEEQLFA